MARKLIFLILVHICLGSIEAQHSPYSLQAAVDALHRREAQLALKDNYNLPARYGIPAAPVAQEQDYWDDDSEVGAASSASSRNNNRHRLNKILARYLAREEENNRNGGGLAGGAKYDFEDDNYLPEEKKRSSFFRERDGKDDPPVSLFRERDPQPYEHSELTDQFLKEIEEARELDREERYKESLRRIWEKYQQQENELEDEIFEDQKRTMAQPNYYVGPLMQRKRTYPVLPWLPMSRRKRFPVAKRSPKMPYDDPSAKLNAEKVPDELRELFGKTGEDKKKRSADEDQSTEAPVEKRNEKNATTTAEGQTEHPPHGGHHHKERKHHKRSDHSHDSQEEEDDESEEHEPEHEEEEEEDEHDHEDFDDDEEAQKKKREASEKRMQKRSNLEVVKEDQILPGDLSNFRKKKSVQWSKYFGIDRRKKSSYDSASKKRISQDDDADDEDKRKKKNIDPERLENMNKKLQSIEDLIIDETVKYTGAHEGIADPEEIARLKDHVVSRLATAYSLEKMRRALEKLRQSVDNENHLLRNVVESEPKSDDDSDIDNQKRLSVKKEKVEFDGLHHSINGPQNSEKSKEPQGNSMSADSDNDDDDEDKKKKKQKKRNGYQRYPEVPNDVSEFEEELGAGHYEPLNDAYLGNKNYVPGSNQCPLIDSMAERCRGVDLLSGDINQELLPICGVHQICYLCGTSQVACDLQYLAEADSICGHNDDCQSAARSVLMILRGSPGPQLGPKECIKNPCLNQAMREIGL